MASEGKSEAVPTVRDRMQAAGLSAGAIEAHHRAGRVSLDGEPVEDLDTPAAMPGRINLLGA